MITRFSPLRINFQKVTWFHEPQVPENPSRGLYKTQTPGPDPSHPGLLNRNLPDGNLRFCPLENPPCESHALGLGDPDQEECRAGGPCSVSQIRTWAHLVKCVSGHQREGVLGRTLGCPESIPCRRQPDALHFCPLSPRFALSCTPGPRRPAVLRLRSCTFPQTTPRCRLSRPP